MPTRARPLQDRIIVKRDEAVSMTEGGIALPESIQEIPQRGTVIAVGPGRTDNLGNLVPMTIGVGDRVLFGTYAGAELEIDGDSYMIMREQDVACVVDGDEQDVKIEVGATRKHRPDIHHYYR